MKYFFIILILIGFSCQKEPNTYSLISPMEGEVLESCCVFINWEQTGNDITLLQIFKDSTLNIESLVFQEPLSRQSKQITEGLFPGKTYWFRLSGGDASLVSSFSIYPHLTELTGIHEVKITKSTSGIGDPEETFFGEMEINVLMEEEQVEIKELKTNVMVTLNYTNQLNIWTSEFVLGNTDYFLIYSYPEQMAPFVSLLFYPNGSDNWPKWFYTSRY